METWDISPRGEKRFLDGHPWVFSNEITSPIKKIQAGDLVRLVNSKGKSIAVGYGNPHSLIAFRCLERHETEITPEWLAQQILKAAEYRALIQVGKYSHRLVFSEADQLPGLIVDCFKTPSSSQVFVIEILTAGMEKLFENPGAVFELFLKLAEEKGLNYYPWSRTTLVLKKDNSFRKMENIEIHDTVAVGELSREALSDVPIVIAQSLHERDYLIFHTDLFDGQKTGFFLDQRSNIELLLKNLPKLTGKTIRILDLFSYVGQWSAQLARHLTQLGFEVHVTCADASQKALDFCAKNVGPHCQDFTPMKMDIVERCGEFPMQIFDIVVCDPPALIKAKKDYDAGKAAYTKVNAAALRALKMGGLFVSCSCSQHLGDQDLIDVLSVASLKSHKQMAWLAKGTQAPDHPMLLEFPQGTYLNSWIGLAKGYQG